MKELLTVGLGLLFAILGFVSIDHGKEWQRTGSAWSWHLPVLVVFGGLSYIATSYLSRKESAHVFITVVDGVLMVGTVALLHLVYRDRTSPVQLVGMAVIALGLVLVALGKPILPAP